jgi:hypothetical protein
VQIKSKVCRIKEIRIVGNKIYKQETDTKNQQNQSQSCEKINKINKPQARLRKKLMR